MAFYADLVHKERWGFVIYRTDYSSEENWQKFTVMMANWTMKIIRNKGPRLSPIIHSWQQMWWFDNQSQFENASIDYLRDHFHNTWYTGLTAGERGRVWPEHYMFLVVDKESLESVQPLEVEIPKHYFGEYPYLKVWDKEAPDEDTGYPGWMKIRLPEVFYLYELALSIDIKNMRALCSKSTDWFSRDLVWYDAYAKQNQDSGDEDSA
jgi:hypothetical protein